MKHKWKFGDVQYEVDLVLLASLLEELKKANMTIEDLLVSMDMASQMEHAEEELELGNLIDLNTMGIRISNDSVTMEIILEVFNEATQEVVKTIHCPRVSGDYGHVPYITK